MPNQCRINALLAQVADLCQITDEVDFETARRPISEKIENLLCLCVHLLLVSKKNITFVVSILKRMKIGEIRKIKTNFFKILNNYGIPNR